MASDKVRIHLYLDASLRAEMELIAAEEHRSVNNTIEMACRALIERRRRVLADASTWLA